LVKTNDYGVRVPEDFIFWLIFIQLSMWTLHGVGKRNGRIDERWGVSCSRWWCRRDFLSAGAEFSTAPGN